MKIEGQTSQHSYQINCNWIHLVVRWHNVLSVIITCCNSLVLYTLLKWRWSLKMKFPERWKMGAFLWHAFLNHCFVSNDKQTVPQNSLWKLDFFFDGIFSTHEFIFNLNSSSFLSISASTGATAASKSSWYRSHISVF